MSKTSPFGLVEIVNWLYIGSKDRSAIDRQIDCMHRGLLPRSANQLAIERQSAMGGNFSNRFLGDWQGDRQLNNWPIDCRHLWFWIFYSLPTTVDRTTTRSRLSLAGDLQEKSLQNLSSYIWFFKISKIGGIHHLAKFRLKSIPANIQGWSTCHHLRHQHWSFILDHSQREWSNFYHHFSSLIFS